MGIFWGTAIIGIWLLLLFRGLFFADFSWTAAETYLQILLQTYLYTGLFITAHDSMHGSVSKNRKVNNAIGRAALALFAAFSYRQMFRKHMEHHKAPGTSEDPDFSVISQKFFPWFFTFFFRYVNVRQILAMAVLFNVLLYILNIPLMNLLFFWILPAFLSTFQLFYFGTFLPHRYPHTEAMQPHNSRTQKKNHLWAMASCYFFGYHYEHHESPRTPWWKLHEKKHETGKKTAQD